ncbi:HAD-IA family hydrolase [Kitasatospora terrestris]|uniref:HAD family hydrolase n=1 Tax=Kitasatospora terrestris TaxID=258051 RepID=A0ABP9DTG5_9ACTN
MTGAAPSLKDVLRPVKHVLLDFDGPVCSVFAGMPAPEIARRLRLGMVDAGVQGTDSLADETDPLALLRLIAASRPDLTATMDSELALLETKATRIGRPNPGGESVLRACAESGRLVSIVSNNAGTAIEEYLDRQGLNCYVTGVYGRTPGDPSSMKPSPRLLLEAMNAARSKPEECIFIGDAVRDVEAGDAANVPTIGYANKPGKEARLAAAGAIFVVESMQIIADVMPRPE